MGPDSSTSVRCGSAICNLHCGFNLSRIRLFPNENTSTVRYSVRISVSVRSVQAYNKERRKKREDGKVVYNRVNAEIVMEIVLVLE